MYLWFPSFQFIRFPSFFHSFIPRFFPSFLPSFLPSSISRFLPSFVHSFIHSFSQSVSQPLSHEWHSWHGVSPDAGHEFYCTSFDLFSFFHVHVRLECHFQFHLHFNSFLSNSPRLPVSKPLGVAVSYFWNLRPSKWRWPRDTRRVDWRSWRPRSTKGR